MVKAFTGPGAEEKAFTQGQWLKAFIGSEKARAWCAERKIALTKATTEGTNWAGGFLVPTSLDAAIIQVRDTVGAFRRNADIRPSPTENRIRPRRIGGMVAGWVAEGATIPESPWTLDAVSSTLKKLACMSRSSAEMWEDESAALAEFVAAEIGNAFATQEDDCGFNGTGTSAYGGIQGLGPKLAGLKSAYTAAAGHNTFATLDSTDIAGLMSSVLATAIPGAKWYVSGIGYALALCRLASIGGGLAATTNADGTITANYLGFPVEFSAKLPNVATTLTGQPMMYFGNLKMASMITESKAGTVIGATAERAFELDEILLRGVRREDIVNHTVGDATTAGAMAALIAP